MMKESLRKLFITALIFVSITFVQYHVFFGAISYRKIHVLLYFQLSFFLIAVPVFWIVIFRYKFCRKFAYRLLIGAIIGLVASKLAIAIDFCEIYGLASYIKLELKRGFTKFITLTLLNHLLCGGIIPGCLYAEVVYRLLTHNRPDFENSHHV